MTLLYRPVLIETAEQAEALPVGTPVLTILTDPGEGPRVVGADYVDDSFDEDLTPGGNWHCVALVPIEAKEEERVAPEALTRAAAQALARAEEAARTYALPPGRLTIQRQARLVTPWAPVAEPIEGEALADCGDRA